MSMKTNPTRKNEKAIGGVIAQLKLGAITMAQAAVLVQEQLNQMKLACALRGADLASDVLMRNGMTMANTHTEMLAIKAAAKTWTVESLGVESTPSSEPKPD
jgi:FlaG/FlaF family flagellin (archaellin)